MCNLLASIHSKQLKVTLGATQDLQSKDTTFALMRYEEAASPTAPRLVTSRYYEAKLRRRGMNNFLKVLSKIVPLFFISDNSKKKNVCTQLQEQKNQFTYYFSIIQNNMNLDYKLLLQQCFINLIQIADYFHLFSLLIFFWLRS